mgnify:FL=1
MGNSSKNSRIIFSISILIILLFSTSIMSTNSLIGYFIYFDDFDDYIVKIYAGSDGPGIWYQHIGGGGSASYSVVQVGDTKFYNLRSTGGVFVKSILAYYFFGAYVGPNDYKIELKMRVLNGEGGVIFRVSDFKKYYLATVYKSPKKLVLWYVNEDEGPGAGPKLGEANIPAGVDVGNWFNLVVWVHKNRIVISVEGQTLLDLEDNRLSSGAVGLYAFRNGEASFDDFWLIMLTEETVTVTTTTTQSVTIPTTTTLTETMTRLTTTYITTTMTGAETTLTKTKTETLTYTTTIPEITTVTESTIVTKTETIETVKTVPGPTETVTTTVAQEGLGLRCLIATAAYGSEFAPQVQALREFRDNFVMQTFAGSNFMTVFNNFYYSWSPYIAEAEYRNDILRNIVKSMISPLISSLEISREASRPLSINPELAVLASGLFASSLISLIYFAPTALIVYSILKWRRVNIRINIAYLLILFGVSLLLFLLAEFLISSSLMMLASSMIVLSTITLTIILAVRMFSKIEKTLLGLKKINS